MGDVVPFKRKNQPEELYDVFVTFTGKWKGSNPEHAAMDLAQSLCQLVEPFMEFYGEGGVVWGEVKKPKKK